jgi:hypothetical protein
MDCGLECLVLILQICVSVHHRLKTRPSSMAYHDPTPSLLPVIQTVDRPACLQPAATATTYTFDIISVSTNNGSFVSWPHYGSPQGSLNNGRSPPSGAINPTTHINAELADMLSTGFCEVETLHRDNLHLVAPARNKRCHKRLHALS